MLVVIAVIAILAAITLPALGKAKSRARRIQCINNQKQLVLTWFVYADEHEGALAPNGYGIGNPKLWVEGTTHTVLKAMTNIALLTDPTYALFAPYLTTPQIYKCPADRGLVQIGGKPFRASAVMR